MLVFSSLTIMIVASTPTRSLVYPQAVNPVTYSPITQQCSSIQQNEQRFLIKPAVNDLTGSLNAEVRFSQAQTIVSRVNASDPMPELVTNRRTLLMVRPTQSFLNTIVTCTPMNVTVIDGMSGETLFRSTMNPPNQLPKTVYYMNIPPNVNTTIPANAKQTVTYWWGTLWKVSTWSNAATNLVEAFKNTDVVYMETNDGGWYKNFYLPNDLNTSLPINTQKYIYVKHNALYTSYFNYGTPKSYETQATNQQTSYVFIYVNGVWWNAATVNNARNNTNNLMYVTDAYSIVLDRKVVRPRMILNFIFSGAMGNFSPSVRMPGQLLIHGADIGMLVSPRGEFTLTFNPVAIRDYFQRIPVAQLIFTQYAPIYFPEVVFADGSWYNVSVPDNGNVYSGSLRQLTKEFIAHGIDKANLGLFTTSGSGEDTYPYTTAQLTAYNSRGNYTNGIIIHGLSGGNGIVTLYGSNGNEVSHEMGHNYGLGHYPNGYAGSVHTSDGNVNSAWGWDSDRNLFSPNFFGDIMYVNASCCGVPGEKGQTPFSGHPFGYDAMAGGEPFHWNTNQFTMHTPYSMAAIQSFMERKAVFTQHSSTGFMKWDTMQQTLVPYVNTVPRTDQIDYIASGMSSVSFSTITSYFSLGYRVFCITKISGVSLKVYLPPVRNARSSNIYSVVLKSIGANVVTVVFPNGTSTLLKTSGDYKFVTQGDNAWTSAPVGNEYVVPRKPRRYGVPVVTILGFYDPICQLRSFIYPALYGSFGYVYPDQSNMLKDTPVSSQLCQLLVLTNNNTVVLFELAGSRYKPSIMNRIHLNLAQEDKPTTVSVVCQCSTTPLATRTILPNTLPLTYYVQGVPLNESLMPSP